MRPTFRSFGVLTIGLTLASTAWAQAPKPLKQLPPTTNVALQLVDGSTVYGRLDRQDADSVVVTGAGGRQAYHVRVIKSVRNAGTARTRSDGTVEYWYPNANTTRLFFGPTGRTLGAGEGYFADHYVFLASASVGLTDRIQFGGGTVLFPLESAFWYVLPKVGLVQSKDFNVAAGAFYGGVDNWTGGIGYVVGTYGSTDRSITAGIGQGISGEDAAGKPVFMMGGEWRMTRGTALVSENYWGSGASDGLLMYGIRFLGERFTVDLAMMREASGSGKNVIPYVDFVIKW